MHVIDIGHSIDRTENDIHIIISSTEKHKNFPIHYCLWGGGRGNGLKCILKY